MLLQVAPCEKSESTHVTACRVQSHIWLVSSQPANVAAQYLGCKARSRRSPYRRRLEAGFDAPKVERFLKEWVLSRTKMETVVPRHGSELVAT